MSNKKLVLILVAMLGIFGACGDENSPTRVAAGEESVEVPDVQGLELRDAARRLEAEGFTVELSPDLGTPEYLRSLEQYLEDETRQFAPSVTVASTEPSSGSEAEEGSAVVLTKLKCANGEECD